jgi:hypothetical protein
MKYVLIIGFTCLLTFAGCSKASDTHSQPYNEIKAATFDYVHRQHAPGFDPDIKCISLSSDGGLARVNYQAGPKDDPVPTTLILANPQLKTRMNKLALSALKGTPRTVEGWVAVRATTTPIETHHGAAMAIQLFQQSFGSCIN